MKVKVKLEHADVIQACVEWARNHFGVEPDSGVSITQSTLGYVSAEFSVKKPDDSVPDDET